MLTKQNVKLLLSILIVFVLTISVPVFSQNAFELTDNGWTYGQVGLQTERLTHDFGYAYFYDSLFSDCIYQNSWWYRTSEDNREYGFSYLTSFVPHSDNSVSLVFEEPGFDGIGETALRFNLTYTLFGLTTNQAYLQTDWSITNLTSDLLTINLFNYTDFDVDIDSEDDYAELQAYNQSFGHIRTWDTGSDKMLDIIATGNGLSGWEIAEWPETKTILTDEWISNLSGQTASLGPGELAAGFQYTFNLTGGQSASGTMFHSVDVVPEPGALSCLATGLIGLAGILRYKSRRG
ncbi:MAG TPA: hypothetical protein PLP86_04450 [Armatimonadota bacterium]|nr:hypothetical protein [Armatimonadota bacterium]HOM71477.1 hypothetical protein [Armatimonadota bacterium]